MTNMNITSSNANTRSFYDIIADLTRRFQAGEKEAYEEIYNRTYKTVLNTIKTCSDKIGADAEDVLQETFMSFYLNASKIADCRCALSWLKKAAYYKTLDHLKKSSSREIPVSVGSESNEDDNYAGLFDIIPDKGATAEFRRCEMALDLRRILDDMRPEYADVIKSFYYDEKSLKTIAKEQGVPEGTVKVRLFRAREEIRMRYCAS